LIKLDFEAGTITLDGPREALDALPEIPGLVHDERTGVLRGPARIYRDVFAKLYRLQKEGQVQFEDQARAYEELDLSLSAWREPYPHQKGAIDAWLANGKRGVVVLPTGAGKSYVAELALWKAARSAMVIAPTIDLMNQWYDILSTSFERPVGILGGGYHEIEPLTVSTYDSAYLHMERLGDRFALLVFDECHHLPGPSVSMIAEMSLAPWRLGLTATPERTDGAHVRLIDMIGPFVYKKGIKDMTGSYLAEYNVITLKVPLSEEDARAYQEARETYRMFTRIRGIRMASKGGWGEFLRQASTSSEGRRAFKAYRLQRRIALAHEGKIHKLEGLLRRHGQDRVIIFTNDNETVYDISRRFLVPAITHQTPTKERKEYLEGFNSGRYPCLVTSKVLNEGVNIPEANVGIIMAGSGTVREHVQRLGRILRRKEGKRALLYEMITADTVEEFVSNRRREHDAYR
jgi:superfamily II DNA or RNA helicase